MTDKGNRWHQVKQTLRRHVTGEVLLRVSADAIMLSFSLAVAYAIRYVVATNTQVLDLPSVRSLLATYSTAYGNEYYQSEYDCTGLSGLVSWKSFSPGSCRLCDGNNEIRFYRVGY